jgi:hypothetical protein
MGTYSTVRSTIATTQAPHVTWTRQERHREALAELGLCLRGHMHGTLRTSQIVQRTGILYSFLVSFLPTRDCFQNRIEGQPIASSGEEN